MVMLMIFTALPISASASTLYYGKTINSGETYTDTSFEMWCWYGNETFTNNGTVNISNGFTLGYQASFVNNSEFTFTGSNSTFGVSSGCSFQNNGTARISGCYNLGLEDSFVNRGTIYLSNISNFNVSGVVNQGTIVCGNGVPDRLIDALKGKTSGAGTVVKEGESTPSTSTRYTITYDLKCGQKSTPDESIFLIITRQTMPPPYYKIGFDKPFDTLNSNLERENYDFIGWTCDKDSSQEPTKYLDIMTNWQSNITLTAHWQPKQQYVYYHLDGGVFSDDITTPEIIKHESGISYSLFNIESDDFTLPTPTKPGYSFIGWVAGGTSMHILPSRLKKELLEINHIQQRWKANGTPYTVNILYGQKWAVSGKT